MSSRALIVVLTCLLGCDPEPTTGDDPVDSGSDTAAEPSNLCADAPITTWDNFGSGFMTQHCQACHAFTSIERNGAPEEVTFDTEAQVADLADRILARATARPPTMPPAGGVSDDDRFRLEAWLTCGD